MPSKRLHETRSLKDPVLRTCVGCGKKTLQAELNRVSRDQEGRIYISDGPSFRGRGAYFCKKRECFEMALKRRAFSRSLRCENAEAVIASLENEIRLY